MLTSASIKTRVEVEEKAQALPRADDASDRCEASDDETDDDVLWRQRSSDDDDDDDDDDDEDGEEWDKDDEDEEVKRDVGAAWPLSHALAAEVDGMTLPSQVEGWQCVQRCLRDALTAAMSSAPLFEPAVVELILNSYIAPASLRSAYIPVVSPPSPSHAPLTDTASKFGGQPYLAPGETWPVCRCDVHMPFWLQLRVSDLPFTLQCSLQPALSLPLVSSACSLFQLFLCPLCYRNHDILGTDHSARTALVRWVTPLPDSAASPSPHDFPPAAVCRPERGLLGWSEQPDIPHRFEYKARKDRRGLLAAMAARKAAASASPSCAPPRLRLVPCRLSRADRRQLWPIPGVKLSGFADWTLHHIQRCCERCGQAMSLFFTLADERAAAGGSELREEEAVLQQAAAAAAWEAAEDTAAAFRYVHVWQCSTHTECFSVYVERWRSIPLHYRSRRTRRRRSWRDRVNEQLQHHSADMITAEADC